MTSLEWYQLQWFPVDGKRWDLGAGVHHRVCSRIWTSCPPTVWHSYVPYFGVQSLFVSDCFRHVRLHAVFSIYIDFGQVNATCVSLPFNLYLVRNLFQNAQGLPAAYPLSFASTLIYNLFLEHGLANGFLNLCRALFWKDNIFCSRTTAYSWSCQPT